MLILGDLQAALPPDHPGGDGGHPPGQGVLLPHLRHHRALQPHPKAQAVEHEHQMVEKFLLQLRGLNPQIHLKPDLLKDFVLEGPHSRVQLDGAHLRHVRRSPHPHDGQQGEQLLLHRDLGVQEAADLLHQGVDSCKLRADGQPVEGGGQLSDGVAGEKAVQHDGEESFKPLLCTVPHRAGGEGVPRQAGDLRV